MLRLLSLFFLLSVSASAQVSFETRTGTQTGLLPNCMQTWYDEEVAAGKQGDFWMWTLASIDYELDGDDDLMAFSHRNIGGHLCKNLFKETGQVTFQDATHGLIADHRLLPTGDGGPNLTMDWDNDGRPDITGLSDSGYPKTLLNKVVGFINVSPAIRYILGFEEIGDFDGNGFQDVWGIFHSHGATSWLRLEYRFNGTNFVAQPAVPYVAPANAPAEWGTLLASLICCDTDGDGYFYDDTPSTLNRFLRIRYNQHYLNGDSVPDLVFKASAGYGGAALGRYCLGQMDGSCLEQTATMGLPFDGYPVYIGDLVAGNGDDILIMKGGAASGLYVNNGAGQFTFAPGPLTAALSDANEPYIHRVFTKDFDGNGFLDVIINSPRLGSVTVLEQTAPGGFSVVLTASGWDSNPVALGDFNDDGLQDFCVGKRETGVDKDITCYINTSVPITPPPPDPLLITTPSPLPAPNYTKALDVEGGVPPYGPWEIESGALPPGLILTPEGVVTNGGETCTFTFTAKVTDSMGASTTKEFQIEAPCVPIASNAPIFLEEPGAVEVLRAKAAANDPAWLALKVSADSLLTRTVAAYTLTGCATNSICYAYQGGGWAGASEALGLAYLVSRNPAYAVKAGQLLDVMAATALSGNLQPLTVDRGYPSRSVLPAVAYILSWVGDALTPAQWAAGVAATNIWFDWFKAASNITAYQRDGPAYSNYYGGHLLGFAALARATAGQNPRAEEIAQYIHGRFEAVTPQAFETGGFAGGYFVESGSYGVAQFGYLIRYMHLMGDARLTGYAKKMARSLIYNLKPNRWQTTDEGNYGGSYTGVLPGFYPLMLAKALKGTTEGGWMQWLYTHLGMPPGNAITIQRPSNFLKVLYEDSSRVAVDYRTTEPLAYCSPGDGHLYSRSSWADDAVWVSFAGAKVWANHESRKAGHVSVQRGNDYLLVNSGQWKGQTGISGSPEVFDTAGWRTNTLFFSDLGEYQSTASAIVGGQSYYGVDSFRCEIGTGYAYAEADLTSAYDRQPAQQNAARRSLRSFRRSVRIAGNMITVTDHIESLKPTYVKKLFWHFNAGGPPVVTGNTIRSTVGSSTVTIQVLTPAAPTIQVVPDGRASMNDTVSLTKRVEVGDSVPGTVLEAKHLITVAQQ